MHSAVGLLVDKYRKQRQAKQGGTEVHVTRIGEGT
jgi:hypothetical protein